MKQNSTFDNQPSNLYLTSDPHPSITYVTAVQEVQLCLAFVYLIKSFQVEEIFKKLCPDKDFLAEQE